MSSVVREDMSNLAAMLTIVINKADYEPKLNSELNSYRKKAHMKGFRKGKTPKGFIKKMYGKALLAEVINELLQKEITGYLTENKLDILGQPLPSEDQAEVDFDVNNLEDYTFKFDLGLAPQVEVVGLDKKNKFKRYAVEIPEDMINKDMDAARKRVGERIEIEDNIEEEDVIELNAEELEDGKVKENGWANTFSVLVNRIDDEKLKKEVLGKKKGDKISFNIYKLEKDATTEHVQKYLLNVTENDDASTIGEEFEATINKVNRIQPAALDQAFFDKYFGEGNVKSEEEAKAFMEKDIVKYYDKQAEALLFRDFQDNFLEANSIELPDAFLKRWLKASNENATDELIEKEYDSFAKNLRWSLIRGKMVKDFEVKVEEEEILENFKDQVRGYFGGSADELIVLNTANRLMEDEQQVNRTYETLLADKLFDVIREKVEVTDEKIKSEDFDNIIKEAREAAEAEAKARTEAAAPEEEVAENVE